MTCAGEPSMTAICSLCQVLYNETIKFAGGLNASCIARASNPWPVVLKLGPAAGPAS
jgi:hypothetical protein